ncbi:SAF domain-containing protein [Trueperella pecoris]|uniref:SAF domain-containing protein n=1 Tax=Trueperella pecoris TaxID=2733571 RepID=A0A7M1QW74_9ACTO|nr:SAF domain-containing protein [Trueperella pecoris]QOR45407.1 hypothetical protein INS88_09130 [Trueperella pecoris]
MAHSHPRRKAPTTARSSSFRALLWRWRWVGVAILVILVIQALAPVKPEVPRYAIVVATKDIAGGSLIGKGDVEIWTSTEDIPGAAHELEAVIGEHAVAPLVAGAPVQSSNLLNSEFLRSRHDGSVIAALPIADAGGLAMVQPGVRIDLYAPPGEFSETQSATFLARDVLVAGIATTKGTSSFLGSTSDTRVFYVAVPKPAIEKVLGVAAKSPVHAVLSGPVS